MVTIERELGLLGVIKQKQKENLENLYLPNETWNVYGGREYRIKSANVPERLVSGYEKTLSGILGGMNLVDLISEKQNPVVIDLMGPSDMLADLSAKNEIRNKRTLGILGIAVSFRDVRSETLRERDESLNIFQIEGDLMDNRTWKKIEERLGGRKADLIIERAAAGLNCIPRDPIFYAAVLEKIWKLLCNQNGAFVGEVLTLRSNFANPAADCLRRNNIDILIGDHAVKVVKSPFSPEDIGHILRRLKDWDAE